MDLILPRSIAGKYFINAIAAAGAPPGSRALIRGKVIGPVASEMSPFYLCDVYPASDREIAITTQTLLTLEQLVGVYFYDDQTTFDAAWRQMTTAIDSERRRVQAAMAKQARQQAKAFAKALEAKGIQVVELGDPRELASLLEQSAEQAGEMVEVEIEESEDVDG